MKPQTVTIPEALYDRIEANGEEHGANSGYGGYWEAVVIGLEVYDLLNSLQLDHGHASQATLQTDTRSMFVTVTKLGIDKAAFSA